MLQIINRMLIPFRERFHHHEAIGCKKTRTRALLIITSLVAPLCMGEGVARADDIYVTKAGSPDPDGSSGKPYQMVEAGIVRAKSLPGSTVIVEGGKYYETPTIDTPCTLTAAGGTVTIGKLDYQASTTSELVTLNTHLFGDGPGDSWQDYERAEDISYFVRDTLSRSPDVVCFQEIWDEDLFLGGDGAGPGIYKRAEYTYGKHGSEQDHWYNGNSGLAIMSQYEMQDWKQVSWGTAADNYCDGNDCWASKGWVRTTILKDGFTIRLFNLHTQAWENSEARSARSNQIRKLTNAIQNYRSENPTHIVFVCGDFNVYGEEAEYYDMLIPRIGIQASGRDADRNSPGFIIDYAGPDPEHEQWTLCSCNKLAMYFDDNKTVSGRLDYIFYFPSLDGSVEVLPTDVQVLPFVGRLHSDDDLTTDQSSDHWALHGKFKLIRK